MNPVDGLADDRETENRRESEERNMPEFEDLLVNGYAYPSISPDTLAWWLPRLTWVSSFSYGFTEDGELINLEDETIIAQAAQRVDTGYFPYELEPWRGAQSVRDCEAVQQ